MDPLNPGWKSSEAWLTLSAKIVSMLVAFGVLSASQGAEASTAIANAITGVFAIWTFSRLAMSYATNRTALKLQILDEPWPDEAWTVTDDDDLPPDLPDPPAVAAA